MRLLEHLLSAAGLALGLLHIGRENSQRGRLAGDLANGEAERLVRRARRRKLEGCRDEAHLFDDPVLDPDKPRIGCVVEPTLHVGDFPTVQHAVDASTARVDNPALQTA